jgi:WD40 repeat protein
VWDPATGNTFFTYTPSSPRGVSALAWSPDGTRVASSGTDVELWNATNGKTVYTFTGNPQSILTMSWSPNGKYIASATGPLETGPVVLQVWLAS